LTSYQAGMQSREMGESIYLVIHNKCKVYCNHYKGDLPVGNHLSMLAAQRNRTS